MAMLQHSYESLAETVVQTARERGYLGVDPHVAITHLHTEPLASVRLRQQILRIVGGVLSRVSC